MYVFIMLFQNLDLQVVNFNVVYPQDHHKEVRGPMLFSVKPAVCSCVYLNSIEQIIPAWGPNGSNWSNCHKADPVYADSMIITLYLTTMLNSNTLIVGYEVKQYKKSMIYILRINQSRNLMGVVIITKPTDVFNHSGCCLVVQFVKLYLIPLNILLQWTH